MATFQTALKISNRHPWSIYGLAWANRRLGNDVKVMELYNELNNRQNEAFIPCGSLAATAVLAGNLDLALSYCQRGLDEKDPMMYTLRLASYPEEMRDDERFIKIYQQLGLPE